MEVYCDHRHSREHLMELDPTALRAMIREHAHHTVEIQLYEALAKDTGSVVRGLLDVWRERGLPTDYPDLAWIDSLLEMAEKAKKREAVNLSRFAWKPFSESDLEQARRLLYGRRTVRHWSEREVPDSMIDTILDAGLWAPHGCNLASIRFLVVREKAEPGLFRGADISGGPVHIVACQDRRVYYQQPGYVTDPQMLEKNRVLDCGAAMQNMVLMAHVCPGAGRLLADLRGAYGAADT